MSGSSSSSKYIAGYWYSADIQMILCHKGPDEINKIMADDYVVLDTPIAKSADEHYSINYLDEENLYGGDSSQGGVQGYMTVFWGDADQVIPYSIATSANLNTAWNAWILSLNSIASSVTTGSPKLDYSDIGSAGMAFRDVCTVYCGPDFKFAANNPYINSFSYRVHSLPDTTGLNQDYKEVITPSLSIPNMNPAHILFNVLTASSDSYGLGLSYSSYIDTDSFDAVAQALYNQSFGIGITWKDGTAVNDFITNILTQTSCVLALDENTGLLRLKQITDDYNVDDLDIVNESIVISVSDYTVPQPGDLYSSLQLSYSNYDKNITKTVTAINFATQTIQSGELSEEKTFAGLNDPVLASRVAARLLRDDSARLPSISLKCNRLAYVYQIGDVFVLDLSATTNLIPKMTVRVVEKQYATDTDGSITLLVTQDIFGDVSPSDYSQEITWTDGTVPPVDAEKVKLVEVPYYEIAYYQGALLKTYVDYWGPDYAFLRAMVESSDQSFDLYTATDNTSDSNYSDESSGSFMAVGVLEDALDVTDDYTHTITLSSINDAGLVTNKMPVMIGDEMCFLTSFDAATLSMTVYRGINDTVPMHHNAGETIWFYPPQGILGVDQSVYAKSETVYAKIVTKTSSGILPLSSAAEYSITFTGRATKPYPPAYLQLNGVFLNSAVTDDLALEWYSRNRLTQTDDTPLKQADSSVPAEANTVYPVVIKDSSENIIYSNSSVSDLSVTLAFLDYSLSFNKGETLNLAVSSKRTDTVDGDSVDYESFTSWNHNFTWGESATDGDTSNDVSSPTALTLATEESGINLYYADSVQYFTFTITEESTVTISTTILGNYDVYLRDNDDISISTYDYKSSGADLSDLSEDLESGSYYVMMIPVKAAKGGSITVTSVPV